MLRSFGVVIKIAWFLTSKYGKLRKIEAMADTDPAKHVEAQKYVSGIMNGIMRTSGMDLTVKGLDNVPRDQAVLFIGNHRSDFDCVAGYATVPVPTAFIAKKEMMKVPLIPRWMLCMKCLFLDRKDIKQGMKTILAAIQRVKEGTSVWVFPEGTRCENPDPAEMLPFKEGSMKIADKTGCPIVPVAILGADKVFEKQKPRIRPAKVTIIYGKPFYAKDLAPEEKKFLGGYTQKMIAQMIQEELKAEA